MALFMKQDFSPPVLSRRWIMIKFRPNMQLCSRDHIISILESGLLFREDSVEVEQEAPSPEDVWAAVGGGKGGWLTKGERIISFVAVSACVAAFPPRNLQRSALINLTTYAALPVAIRFWHRYLCRGSSLRVLLSWMRDYLALARRAAACIKECAAVYTHIGSMTTVIESTHLMLCRQQSELAILMSRASSALLGNAPWLRADVAWDAVDRRKDDNLLKIHHAFLVVQSTLLKHIAMAHFIPSAHAQKIYKNHNERIHWIHTILIEHLSEEFKENYEALDRMYRLLRNYGNKDSNKTKKPGFAINDSWLYSDVHSDVARACLEIKLALNKCTNLDMFLDTCALNKQELDLGILNKDLDDLIDNLTKCLSTAQSSQIRLKKLKSKFGVKETKEVQKEEEGNVEVEEVILRLDDKEPESKDEVFYLLKTEDDADIQPSGDITTGPGEKERETTRVVLKELKRKLVRREDVMRERERQALAKTMPEYKDSIPEFPRQIKIEEVLDRKGYLMKLRRETPKKLFRTYKIEHHRSRRPNNYKLKINTYENESEVKSVMFEANENLNVKSRLITVEKNEKNIIITRWCKSQKRLEKCDSFSEVSDVDTSTSRNESDHKENNGEVRNFKFTKRDLELTPSSSDSDFDDLEKRLALLHDVRRHRVARRKHYPVKRQASQEDVVDESLRPMEYSFGTGMAMASVLQVNSKAKMPNMVQEEVFIGDGEVSDDSGNDEDA